MKICIFFVFFFLVERDAADATTNLISKETNQIKSD